MMNILVLCTSNSAPSILLESILTHRSDGRVKAWSAGSKPAGKVHSQSLKLLEAKGFPVDGLISQSWNDYATADAPQMDAVITVCGSVAGEKCPYWPGAPLRAHWGIEDPATAAPEAQPAAFVEAYRLLSNKAARLLDLPFEEMSKDDLQAILNRIGR